MSNKCKREPSRSRRESQDEDEVFAALRNLAYPAASSLKPSRVIQETQRNDRATFFRNFKGQRLEKFTRERLRPSSTRTVGKIFHGALTHGVWNETHRDLYLSMRKKVETVMKMLKQLKLSKTPMRKTSRLQGEGHSLEDVYICVRMNEVRLRRVHRADIQIRRKITFLEYPAEVLVYLTMATQRPQRRGVHGNFINQTNI